MNKSQYIILIFSIITVGVIFLLPKVVVSDDENLLDTSIIREEDAHSKKIEGDKSAINIENLLASLAVKSTRKDSLLLITDLVDRYQNNNHYDSAAYLAEYFVNNQLDYLILAAETYYDAYTFAVKADRVSFFSEKAQIYLKEALELDDTLFDIKVKLGMTYVNSSNPMQGILMMREVLEVSPDNELALFSLGVLSMQSGQYEKAITRFEKLRRVTVDDSQAVFYLGICYKELNQIDKAKELFQYIIDNSEDEEVKNTVKPYLNDLM